MEDIPVIGAAYKYVSKYITIVGLIAILALGSYVWYKFHCKDVTIAEQTQTIKDLNGSIKDLNLRAVIADMNIAKLKHDINTSNLVIEQRNAELKASHDEFTRWTKLDLNQRYNGKVTKVFEINTTSTGDTNDTCYPYKEFMNEVSQLTLEDLEGR